MEQDKGIKEFSAISIMNEPEGRTTLMKKALCLLFVLGLILSACAGSYAERLYKDTEEIRFPSVGFLFTPPEAYRNAKGIIMMENSGSPDEIFSIVNCSYYAMTDERFSEFRSQHGMMLSPGETWTVFSAFSVGRGMTFSEYNRFTGGEYDEQHVREIGKAGDVSFYLYMEDVNPELAETIDPAYRDDYITLANTGDEAAASFTFFEPVEPQDPYAGIIGTKIKFTTADADGNTVSSAELFAQNDITLLNIWTTWCGPCIGELEDLQGIHKSMQNKGVGVIGLLADDDLNAAHELMDEYGVKYPVILAPDNLDEFFLEKCYPSTFFIGRDGTVLTDPVIGAMVARYKTILNELLRQMK